ncbi:CidA/LrgA family protein [Uliginosibacterium sp. H1]|uniref:CidA/LrgA family protein n=1 Tax=Uliginosibacterium sp. H1 TaxID=3114757 RepID=UPI002E17332B|nr:CidA/LrgA family protein [Uliginosibacterium sp. H1]
MNILIACCLLLALQLAGESLARAFNLPLPGPVIGMLMLACWLGWRGLDSARGTALQQTCSALLGNLSLLFVPAAVGVMLHLHRLRDEWLPILVALVLSTAIGLAVTAGVVQWLVARQERKEASQGGVQP